MAAVAWSRVLDLLTRYVLQPVGLTPEGIYWFVVRVPRFFLVVFLFYLAGRGTTWLLDKLWLTRRRADPMFRSLVESLVFAFSIILGLGLGLLVFGVNIVSLAVTVGLIGAALALGFRNTVANVMGGIALATDQPFEVGDRIQVGEFWGDVVDIGLRSTRVLTARREFVIIPNSLMDEREIWNYTARYPELRVEVSCTISYDSDVDRARRLMERVARETEEVLDFPEPRALNRGFLDSGVELELWCHIGNARRRYHVTSRLRDAIHAAFREHGVEIPYPYRTLVEKTDLPAPQRGIPEGYERDHLGDRRILVAVSGEKPARQKADAIAELAGELEADIVLAFIASHPSIMVERDGEMAAEFMQRAARRHGVDVKLVMEEGEIVDTIRRLVDREGCGAVVIGASAQSGVMSWRRAYLEDRLRQRLDVPLIVVPQSLAIDPQEVEAAREALDAGGAGQEGSG